MPAKSVREIMDGVSQRFDSAVWGEKDSVLQFDIEGEGGGQWTAHIANGAVEVTEGLSEDPDMSFSTDSDTFIALANGDLDGMSAFMSGKVNISGNLSLALKLQDFLG